MPWFRIDDQSHSNPKVIMAGNEAWGLYCRLGAWSSMYLTNGYIPTRVAMSMGSEGLINDLIDVGLLDLLPEDGGLQVHNYLDRNPSREEVEAERDRSNARVARHRKRKCNAVTPPVTPEDVTAESRRSNVGPSPSPIPSPMIERDSAKNESQTVELTDLEQAGFQRYGALAGSNVAKVRRLMPLRQWEVDAALATKGRSWGYFVKVIESTRDEQAKPPAPPGQARPPRKGGGSWVDGHMEELERIEEEENGPDRQKRVLGDPGPTPRKLPPTGSA